MKTEDLIHFCPPGRLLIGNGVRFQLPSLLAQLGFRRGAIVTDAFFAHEHPWIADYIKEAKRNGITYTICAEGAPDPTTTLCDHATHMVRDSLDGIVPDHIVAVGGGSNIDLAKAMSLTIPGGRSIAEFTGDIGGCQPIPMVAVPTTAGTGSEATPGAILVDPDNATKVAVMDNALRPQIAVVDPELTYTCPPRVTADAGIDAFTHAIESYLTQDSCLFDRGGNPDPGYSGRSAISMLFAKEAMRLCLTWMERAYTHGEDHEARSGMAYASIYAALSYGSAGLNAVHGIAYAVAGVTHKSHGSTNAVMLPYVLDEYCNSRRSEMVEISRMMGVSESNEEDMVRRVPVLVRDMIGRLGIPTDLQSFGVGRHKLNSLLEDALGVSRLAKAFPVEDRADAYHRIVHSAWAGELSGDVEKVMLNI